MQARNVNAQLLLQGLLLLLQGLPRSSPNVTWCFRRLQNHNKEAYALLWLLSTTKLAKSNSWDPAAKQPADE